MFLDRVPIGALDWADKHLNHARRRGQPCCVSRKFCSYVEYRQAKPAIELARRDGGPPVRLRFVLDPDPSLEAIRSIHRQRAHRSWVITLQHTTFIAAALGVSELIGIWYSAWWIAVVYGLLTGLSCVVQVIRLRGV